MTNLEILGPVWDHNSASSPVWSHCQPSTASRGWSGEIFVVFLVLVWTNHRDSLGHNHRHNSVCVTVSDVWWHHGIMVRLMVAPDSLLIITCQPPVSPSLLSSTFLQSAVCSPLPSPSPHTKYLAIFKKKNRFLIYFLPTSQVGCLL